MNKDTEKILKESWDKAFEMGKCFGRLEVIKEVLDDTEAGKGYIEALKNARENTNVDLSDLIIEKMK